MYKLFHYDLETTGANFWEHGVHQISAIVEIDDDIRDEINLHVAPHFDAVIDQEALKVAGVTYDVITAYPPMKEVYSKIKSILEKYVDRFDSSDKFHLVGYNEKFDNGFFREFWLQNNDKYFGSYFWSNSICVMSLASDHLKAERHLLPNFKLMTVAKYLGIEVDEKRLHDSFYDTYLAREIYKIIKH